MYKTAFAPRVDQDTGEGYLDCCIYALWPPSNTEEFIKATIALKGGEVTDSGFFEELAAAGFPDVEKMCQAMHPMQLRAQFNALEIYIVESDDIPTDEELLNHAKNQRDARRRRASDA